MSPRWSLVLAFLAAACTAPPLPTETPFGRQAGGAAYDGTYAGDLVLLVGASPETCPRSFGQPVLMVVRNGEARIDLAIGAYFSGNVGANGQLTMISGGGRTAFLHGRFADGVFTGAGSGACQYQARLNKQPATAAS